MLVGSGKLVVAIDSETLFKTKFALFLTVAEPMAPVKILTRSYSFFKKKSKLSVLLTKKVIFIIIWWGKQNAAASNVAFWEEFNIEIKIISLYVKCWLDIIK